jgi:hypothetical protein
MPASVSTTESSFEMVVFCEDKISIFIKIIIFALNERWIGFRHESKFAY